MEESDKMLTLKDLCNELSISAATAKNWLRLGKINCSCSNGKAVYFSREYIDTVKAEIISSSDSTLKSRRNKKFISGNNIYKSYISKDSPNNKAVSNLICALSSFDTFPINLLLAECALRLKCSEVTGTTGTSLLCDYLLNKLDIGGFHFLIDGLIDDLSKEPNDWIDYIESHLELFKIEYTYNSLEDTLGYLYISLRNMTDRKATGAYYTPAKVIHQLTDNLFSSQSCIDCTVLDPCCGTGNFLLQLPDTLHYSNVYGNDLDSTAIQLARINMALKYNNNDYSYLKTHFTCGDFLTSENYISYDFIIGNPPWGYDFSALQKHNLKNLYASANNDYIESYDLFIEKSLNHLKLNGVMAFVLPEAILNVRAHRIIRQMIMDNLLIKQVEYLENIFNKVYCPSIILKMQKNTNPFSTKGVCVTTSKDNFVINTERKITSEYFNLKISDKDYNILCKIYKSPCVYLTGGDNGNSDFGLGVVTGANDSFLLDRKTETNEEIIKGTDVFPFRIGKISSYIEFLPDNMQQSAPEYIYRESEKLIYRFIGKKLIFALDTKKRITLNSCNVLIPRLNGLDIRFIMAVLNSEICQFIFSKKFDSIKVLRRHIEQLPIPVASQDSQNHIISLVEQLMNPDITENEFVQINKILNQNISQLYSLSDEDNKYISSKMRLPY